MFKPKSKRDIVATIKDYLLNGYIIRYDGRDEKPLEVIPRNYVNHVPTMGNIGQCSAPLVDEIFCSHELFYELVRELKEEFSVRRISCSGSGCCQYHTYAIYLD